MGLGALTTTAGMWAVENKWIGGKDMAVDFALNAVPFGLGKAFSYMRNSAMVAMNASKAWIQTLAIGGMYVAEGAVDV